MQWLKENEQKYNDLQYITHKMQDLETITHTGVGKSGASKGSDCRKYDNTLLMDAMYILVQIESYNICLQVTFLLVSLSDVLTDLMKKRENSTGQLQQLLAHNCIMLYRLQTSFLVFPADSYYKTADIRQGLLLVRLMVNNLGILLTMGHADRSPNWKFSLH